jgi:tRNA dimethylallyltransferase
MINIGLIKEAQEIIKLKNIPKNHPALNSINYKEAIQVINGELDASELEEKCVISTRQLVKRQITWMRVLISQKLLISTQLLKLKNT